MRIPIYSALSPRHQQYVNLAAGGLGMLAVALITSTLIGNAGAPGGGVQQDLPRPKALGAVPGAALDPKDAWIGGAGKDVATLKNEVRQHKDELTQMRSELKQTADALRSQMTAMMEHGAWANSGAAAAAAAPASSPARPAAVAGPGVAAPPPLNQPMTFAPQRGIGYPPGQPNTAPVAAPGPAGAAPGGAMPTAQPLPPPALLKVTLRQTRGEPLAEPPPQAGVATGRREGPAPRHVGQFLPVGFTRAVLLGGLAAPTGGQAQSNPVPVLLRLVDLSVLPNGFRGQTKDCLVIGEGYGDHSAERAYIRATLLSCVLRDGRVLEVAIKGSVFGDDGMNGVSGTLVTKQGAILGNAMVAGVASGIGGGIAAATQSVNNTALGAVTSTPTDTASILRMGVGTGVAKALDRLAQYYISLAEKTFPVIEILPGRPVDVVVQQGVALDAALAAIGPGAPSPVRTRGSAPDADRTALLRAAVDEGDDE